jgi:hypothetical protein
MGNRLSKIYTKTGDDGGRNLMSQDRASCAACGDSDESRGIRRCPDASRRPRAGIHARVVLTA